MRRDFSMVVEDHASRVIIPRYEDATIVRKRRRFTKRDERAAMAELRAQREARAAQHRDPDWVAKYWEQVSRS